ncbi:MAG TPA: hypothetical protein VGL94_22480 [Ktedonobacteraceae bacterium]
MVREHAMREIKDAISRDILETFDQARIGIASPTFDIVGFPPIHLEQDARTGSHHQKI